MRIVKASVLVLLLCVFSLAITRYLLLDQIVILSLQWAGASEVTVHVADIGIKQIQVDFLSAAFDLNNGQTIHAKARNIALQYDLMRLLKTKKCDLLAMQKVEISRTGIDKNPSPTLFNRLPEKLYLIKDELRTRLPIDKIQLKQVILHDDLPAQLTDRNIQIEADVSGTALNATARLQMDTDTVISLVLQSPDAMHGTVNIVGRRHQEEEILQSKIVLRPDGLTGTVSLRLNPVRELLLQSLELENTEKIPAVDGQLNGSFLLPLPVRQDSPIQAEITLADKDNHLIHLEAGGTPDTGVIKLLLTGRAGEQGFLNTNLEMKQERISGTYSLQSELLSSFLRTYLEQPLPEISGLLTGDLDVPLPGNKEQLFRATAAASSLALPDISASSARLILSGELGKNTVHLDKDAAFKGRDVFFGKTAIKECGLDLAGNFKRNGDQLRLAFAEQQEIHIKGLTAGSTRIPDLLLRPAQALGLSLDLNQKTWSFEANTLKTASLLVTIGSVDISTGPLRCAFSTLRNTGSSLEIATTLETPTIVIDTEKMRLPLKNLTGTFQLKQKQISSGLLFAPEVIPGRARARIKHDLIGSAGSFDVRTDKRLDLNGEEITLADLFSNWQSPLDLDKGSLSFKSIGSWAPDRKFRLSLLADIKGGSGYFQQYLFNGLDMRQDLVLLPRLRSKNDGFFSLRQLISGVDIHDLRAKTALVPVKTGNKPEIQIKQLKGSLIKGSVSSPVITYDLNRPDSSFTLNIRRIDLATLVELVQVKGLHVTGSISGSIPVTIKGKSVSVDNGTLRNDPPGGEISYTPENLNAAGLSGYALRVVKDFRYESLKTTAKYFPSGQLDLAIGLRGISLELDKNRPVHFNIHVEQNLPALLQGLRYSKGLTKELDKRVRQRYK